MIETTLDSIPETPVVPVEVVPPPEGHIPKDSRKTILMLSDDMRFPSGVGTMSKEIIVNTAHLYNWVQVGAGISHPEQGKIVDLSQAVNEERKMDDASVKVYPYNGYGDQPLIRHLIKHEKIDMIVHFTDPRFWGWLYHMEHELRQSVPIVYYTIWDELPYPRYNRDFYRSCDALFAISRQSYNIVKQVLGKDNVEIVRFE